MSLLARIVELLMTGRRLSAAKPHVLSALAGLAIVISLSVFAIVMAALMVCALIWLAYGQMLEAGASIAAAGGITALFTLAILAVTLFAAVRIWRDVRAEVSEVFRTQAPLSPISDTANAFIDGLMTPTRRGKHVQ